MATQPGAVNSGRTIPVRVAPDGRQLSDDALDHLRMILLNRPDIEVLRVEIRAERCTLCDEILRWARTA
jgi:hypothetical protein